MESLATQTLIIFAILTRKVPFFRSRPGLLLTLAAFAVVAVGVVLTLSPLAHPLGFTTLPWQFFTALVLFHDRLPGSGGADEDGVLRRADATPAGAPHRTRGRVHRIQRRAARFSHPGRIVQPDGAPAPVTDIGAKSQAADAAAPAYPMWFAADAHRAADF